MRSQPNRKPQPRELGLSVMGGENLKTLTGFPIVCGAAVILTLIVVMTSGPSAHVRAAPLLFVQEPMIVSKELLTGQAKLKILIA